MKLISTEFEGLIVVENDVFKDQRGYFSELFNSGKLKNLGIPTEFHQDNFSVSQKGVLRGLHFQKNPHGQGKYVRVLNGRVWDVAVDLRRSSKTFGKTFSIELSAENGRSMYIPVGFAHGFCVLSEHAEFFYKCTSVYSPTHDCGIMWNDPDLNIRWPIDSPNVSEKDQKLLAFKDCQNFF